MPRKKNTMLRTPDGIIDLLELNTVQPTETGVAMLRGDMLQCFIKISDEQLRRKISKLVSDCLYAAKNGEKFDEIDWAKYGLYFDVEETV